MSIAARVLRIALKVVIGVYAVAILGFVWLTKDLTFATFARDPIFASYSIAVVIYVLGRFVFALFYRPGSSSSPMGRRLPVDPDPASGLSLSRRLHCHFPVVLQAQPPAADVSMLMEPADPALGTVSHVGGPRPSGAGR